ncbi:MAG: formyltetrahydrofolate deformylase [Gammaproteobacteria bacterium]|nr:formyltetrahydrofolate deformylase [Gammaproteobacteria bacterium]
MRLILLFSCLDKPGLVAQLSSFVYEHGGNIHSLDEHVNSHLDGGESHFFIRIEWSVTEPQYTLTKLESAFSVLVKDCNATWKIRDKDKKLRIAIFVSKYDHCLREILWRHQAGELAVEIPLIISNHNDLSDIATQHGIAFRVFPMNREMKLEQENKECELLDSHNIDTVVLARYMQVLSPEFVQRYKNQIINIHHSFLPAFIGSDPYKQAYERGVKIIGATSHYVTSDLDEGPIIEQDIARISHRESREDLIRKGRDVERLVLIRALEAHCNHRVLVSGCKTIVFS